MSKICYNCGNENIDEAKFCTKCGKIISDKCSEKKNKYELIKKILIIGLAAYIVLCIIAFICGISDSIKEIEDRRTQEFNDTIGAIGRSSWAEDIACKEIKSDIYVDYGYIANVSGELIYQDDHNYVVVVRYEIPNWGWEGSCACLVHGYSVDNCFVNGKTTEMPYEYDYRANLDELKALWKLD